MMDLSFLDNGGIRVEKNSRLSLYTTFKLGGECRGVVTCAFASELETVTAHLRKKGVPFVVVGGGSNLLVSDHGVDAAVIRYMSEQPQIEEKDAVVKVSGGTLLDDACAFAAGRGLAGLNFASGIPGTVGGALYGNAGAFGRQISDCLKSVTLLSLKGEQAKVPAQKLRFQYRRSSLGETGDIVLSAEFFLTKGNKDALVGERKDILAQRRDKHPDWKIQATAGSFFRNIEPTSKAAKRQAAGWFLEQVGAKDLKVGGASVFPKHANIIIAASGATAQDVYDLSLMMQQAVLERFQLKLEREVRLMGNFKGGHGRSQAVIW